MSDVYLEQTEDRAAFIKAVFERLGIQEEVSGKSVLLKPNIVSGEPYPTTTHPEVIQTCVQLLRDSASKIVVADGPAWDAGDTQSVIDAHPLKHTCDELGVRLVNVMCDGIKKVKTRSYELEIAQMAFDYDFIVSLPVLKSHGMGLTGALKNQFGLVQTDDKLRSHRTRDMNLVLGELNEVVRPQLYIVDAVQTLIDMNEVRHGGRPHPLGYMLAGTDPVSLDAAGLPLLKKVEPKLKDADVHDILHVKNAAAMGVGQIQHETIEI